MARGPVERKTAPDSEEDVRCRVHRTVQGALGILRGLQDFLLFAGTVQGPLGFCLRGLEDFFLWGFWWYTILELWQEALRHGINPTTVGLWTIGSGWVCSLCPSQMFGTLATIWSRSSGLAVVIAAAAVAPASSSSSSSW